MDTDTTSKKNKELQVLVQEILPRSDEQRQKSFIAFKTTFFNNYDFSKLQ